MLTKTPSVKTLSVFMVLCVVAGPTLLTPSQAFAITGSPGSERGGRPEPEIITMETLVSMSEAGLRYVLNNPRGYKLDDSRLSTRHLGALASALIYTPNRSRRLIARLKRARSDRTRSFIVEIMLVPNHDRSRRLAPGWLGKEAKHCGPGDTWSITGRLARSVKKAAIRRWMTFTGCMIN
jgi:hypothetical protein